jgi:hypothetical protein
MSHPPLLTLKNWVKLAMSPYSKYRRSRTFDSLSTIRARCTGSDSVLCGCIYVGGLPLYHNFKPSRIVFWYSSGHRQWNGRDPSYQSHHEDSAARVIQSFAASISFRPLSFFAFASRICFQWALYRRFWPADHTHRAFSFCQKTIALSDGRA